MHRCGSLVLSVMRSRNGECARPADGQVPSLARPLGGTTLAARQASHPGTHVTVVLPRRGTAPLLGRLLHDRTADKIARLVSRIPRSAATIIPFDISARVDMIQAQATTPDVLDDATVPDPSSGAAAGTTPIAALTSRQRVTVDGRVHSIEIRQVGHSCILTCTITDPSGELINPAYEFLG